MSLTEIYGALSDRNDPDYKRRNKHVFIDKHDIYGELKNFDSSYDMAESFRRLHEGKNIQPHDLILLKHERLEAELMNRYGCTQSRAHILASRKYNYVEALTAWQKERDSNGET